MDSTINTLVTLVRNDELIKIAVTVTEGLSTFPNYEYFREAETIEQWKVYLPQMNEGFVIVAVEDITAVYSY